MKATECIEQARSERAAGKPAPAPHRDLDAVRFRHTPARAEAR